MADAAGRIVLVNDLVRSLPGFLLLAYPAPRLLTTSAVVHYDGPQSVRAAFTLGGTRDGPAGGLLGSHSGALAMPLPADLATAMSRVKSGYRPGPSFMPAWTAEACQLPRWACSNRPWNTP